MGAAQLLVEQADLAVVAGVALLVVLAELPVAVLVAWVLVILEVLAVKGVWFFIGQKGIDMRYAWIENDKIRDVAHSNPSEIYHPDVAVFYNTQVPEDATNGDGWVNGKLVKPKPQPAPAPAPRRWTDVDFRAGMTLAEKTKWDNDAVPEIKTVKQELPKERAEAVELLDFLVSVNVISQNTSGTILGSA